MLLADEDARCRHAERAEAAPLHQNEEDARIVTRNMPELRVGDKEKKTRVAVKLRKPCWHVVVKQKRALDEVLNRSKLETASRRQRST